MSTIIASPGSLRRLPESRPIRIGPLWIDPQSRQVAVDGQPVSLADIEFRLLLALAEAPTQVFTRQYLLERVWHWRDAEHSRTRTLDVHVSRLRSKLGQGWLINAWGVGYRLTDPDPASYVQACCPTCGSIAAEVA